MVQTLIARAAHTDPEIAEVELPQPDSNEVTVAVRAAGVCHSDLSMIDGVLYPSFPLVLGHEASGVVTATGPDVTRVGVGDHVVLNWTPPCRSCWFCLHAEPWLCTATEGVASLPRGALTDGTPTHVTLGVGALAEQVVIGENAVIGIPGELPLAESALIGCAVVTGVGAVRNNARVRPGESAVVVGLGGVGLAAVAGARLSGADPVIGIDSSESKQELALAAGATHFLQAGDRVAKEARKLTGGRGADVALECAGRSAAIRTAWQSSRRGARVVILGVGSADDHVSFSGLELYHFARSISVSVYGSADPDIDVPKLAESVRTGELDLNTFVTDRIGLSDAPEAFDRMRRGEGGRSLVLFD